MKKSRFRSLNCYFRFLHNRVRYWELVTVKETDKSIAKCTGGFLDLLNARAKMLHHEGEGKGMTWTTDADTPGFSDNEFITNQKRM
jgi:hypothetical protein